MTVWVTRGSLAMEAGADPRAALLCEGHVRAFVLLSCASGRATVLLSSPRLSVLTALPVPLALPNKLRQEQQQKCRLESTLYFGISERII